MDAVVDARGNYEGRTSGSFEMRRFRGGRRARGWRLRSWDWRSSIRGWTGWWWRSGGRAGGAGGAISMATVLITGDRAAVAGVRGVLDRVTLRCTNRVRSSKSRRRWARRSRAPQADRRRPDCIVARCAAGGLLPADSSASPHVEAKCVRGPPGRGASRLATAEMVFVRFFTNHGLFVAFFGRRVVKKAGWHRVQFGLGCTCYGPRPLWSDSGFTGCV